MLGRGRLWKALIVPVTAHLGLWFTFDLAESIGWSLFWVAVGFAGLAIAEVQFRRGPVHLRLGTMLLVAVLLRAILLPLPPSLSGDIDRYIWDGRVSAAGFDPYVLPPAAPELEALRDEIWQRLDHRDVATVYPPLAQLLFALASSLPEPLLALKTLLVALDLIACLVIWKLARLWRIPEERTLWYAWSPLVTVEIAGMGHVDSLGVMLVVLTTLLVTATPQRTRWAVVTATGAVLSKLVPVLAVPVWARHCRRGWLVLLGVVALSTVVLLPVVLGSGGIPSGLVKYSVSWEFNGPIFEPLWRLLVWLELDAAVEETLNLFKDWTGWHDFWNHFYPYNYAQLWAKIILAVGLSIAVWAAWKTRSLTAALQRVFGAIIVFSATVYPWYVLWVLPWAALRRSRSWLWLSGALFLSYISQVSETPLFPWIHALIWMPFVWLWFEDR